MTVREAVIVDTARTADREAQGRARRLAPHRSARVRAARRCSSATTSIPALIDDVVGGCVTQSGEQGCNVTRNAWVAAGLPWHVPATSVDRQCGSSQQAAHFVAQGVIAGAYDLGDRVRRRVDDPRADVVERARRHRAVQPRLPREHGQHARHPVLGRAGARRQVRRSRARRWTRSRSRATAAPRRTPTTGSSPARSCRCRSRTRTASSPARCSRADEGIRRGDDAGEARARCRRRGSPTTSPRRTSPPATRRR